MFERTDSRVKYLVSSLKHFLEILQNLSLNLPVQNTVITETLMVQIRIDLTYFAGLLKAI
jgi:hypothetical protein